MPPLVSGNPAADSVTSSDIERLVDFLHRHSAADHPIHAGTLAIALGWEQSATSPKVRATVAEAIRLRVACIGSEDRGFYIVRTKEELDAARSALASRRDALEARIHALGDAFYRQQRLPEGVHWIPEIEEVL